MGKNTPARQEFIIDNLRLEKDLIISDALPEPEIALA
jgi:topoisomerase-4 subunit B